MLQYCVAGVGFFLILFYIMSQLFNSLDPSDYLDVNITQCLTLAFEQI